MATINSQLILTDLMSGPLSKITKALNIVINTFESMQTTVSKPIDVSGLAAARDMAAEAAAEFEELGNKAKSASDKTGDSLSRLVGALGLAKLAGGALSVAKTGIEYASDLVETQNVVDVTFEDASASVSEWAKNCIDSYGMNEVSAKRYLGTLGAMLKSSGVTGNSLTDMSERMVGLAGDMASFYNLDLETAFEKIRSGISGETEPLKQLGINMSVANLEAYALSQGITTAYNEMTQAEQVMLRYNYLISATDDAQGDYADTQGTYANQTRHLSESWLEFTGVLSAYFLPILTQVTAALDAVVGFMTEHSDVMVSILTGLAVALGIIAVAWAVYTVSQWLAVAANVAFLTSILPIVGIALLIGAGVALIVLWLVKFVKSLGGTQNAWEIFKLSIIVGWNAIKLGFFTGIYWVIDLVDKLKLSWQKAGVAIANFMGDMKVSVLTILQNLINGAIDIINKFIGVLNKVPGVSLSTIEHVTFATTAAAENEAAKSARAENLAAYENELANAKAGRDAHIESLKSELDSSVEALQSAYAKVKADAAATDAASEQSQTLENISDDTKTIAASAELSNEELAYLRDIAEKEAINRFTTAEVKIDMTGMTNRIDSTLDIDGIISRFTEGFSDALSVAAELP